MKATSTDQIFPHVIILQSWILNSNGIDEFLKEDLLDILVQLATELDWPVYYADSLERELIENLNLI